LRKLSSETNLQYQRRRNRTNVSNFRQRQKEKISNSNASIPLNYQASGIGEIFQTQKLEPSITVIPSKSKSSFKMLVLVNLAVISMLALTYAIHTHRIRLFNKAKSKDELLNEEAQRYIDNLNLKF
jgi:hypothetical protein